MEGQCCFKRGYNGDKGADWVPREERKPKINEENPEEEEGGQVHADSRGKTMHGHSNKKFEGREGEDRKELPQQIQSDMSKVFKKKKKKKKCIEMT